MQIVDKKHITLSPSDVQDLIIKALYHTQGISGIFSVKFKIYREFRSGIDPHDSDYIYVFDGADVTVE
jgi:hypothetical protein